MISFHTSNNDVIFSLAVIFYIFTRKGEGKVVGVSMDLQHDLDKNLVKSFLNKVLQKKQQSNLLVRP